MSVDPKRVETLFSAALSFDPTARAAFLAAECAGDVELRERVERLLAAHDELAAPPGTTDFTPDRPTATFGDSPPTEDHAPRPDAGTMLAGKYKLVEEIGEGGMGSVWMAQQTEPVKRLVAVKLIKPGMDSRAVLARFEAERQALALMDHPNIARVLDAGATLDGRPFFVMELVKGVPITKFCDDNRLTPRQRLELFVPVCQAIQHAHQKGVIHRDIKPSNVLVALYDDRPVPKVIDFGVAKATGQALTERTLATGFGAVVGTPEYMSPEQASFNNLDIDTRSDVYALGALLYELLAGSPPFSRKELENAGLLEILRVVREVEPPRPSMKLSTADALPTLSANRGTEPKRLTALLRGELDWIVMKALEKDRARRYETANGFAADVQRFLAGEPVLAVPPSVTYRLKKFLGRNRGPVVATVLLFVALVAGIAGTTWGLIRADRAREDEARRAEGERVARGEAERATAAKEAARAAEARERSRAEANQKLAEAKEKLAVEESAIAKGVGQFLQRDLLLQVDTRTQVASRWVQRGEFQIQQNPTIRELLDRAARELTPDRIEAKFPNQPRVQAEILRTIGQSYFAVGEYPKAIDHLGRSAAIFERVFGPDHRDTLIALHSQAQAHWRAGQNPQTIAILLRVRDSQTKTVGPTHPDTLTTLHNLGLTYLLAGKTKEGIELLEHVRQKRVEQFGDDHPSVLETLATLGEAYVDTNRTTEAIEILERVRKVWVKKPGIEHPDTLVVLHNLAMAYGKVKRLDESIALYERVLDTETRTLGAEHPETLGTLSSLANALLQAGQTAKAIEYYERAWTAQKKNPGPNHLNTLQTQTNLGYAYRKAGKVNEGLALSEDALNRMRVHVGPDHPQTMIAVEALALAYRSAKRLDKSLPLQEELLKFRKAKFGPEHDKTFELMGSLANAYYSLGKLDLAVPMMEATLPYLKVKFGPEHDFTLATMNNLGESYRAIGKVDQALPLLEEGYARTKAKFGPEHSKTLTSLGNLGLGYLSAGKLDRAVPLLEESHKLWKVKHGQDHPATLDAMNNLAGAYHQSRRLDLAIPLYEETLDRKKATLGPTHPLTLMTMFNLAVAYLDADRREKGKATIDAYLAVYRKTSGMTAARFDGMLAQISLRLLELGHFTTAEPYLRECLAAREKTLPDSWLTFNTRSMLGGALLGQNKYAEAEPLLVSGYEGMKKREALIPAAARIRLPEAADRLCHLYTAWGNKDKSAQWRAERAKYPPQVAPMPHEVKR